eukprot:scaffold29873_cov40-Prasinocladus_malaysianus.AAC.1
MRYSLVRTGTGHHGCELLTNGFVYSLTVAQKAQYSHNLILVKFMFSRLFMPKSGRIRAAISYDCAGLSGVWPHGTPRRGREGPRGQDPAGHGRAAPVLPHDP